MSQLHNHFTKIKIFALILAASLFVYEAFINVPLNITSYKIALQEFERTKDSGQLEKRKAAVEKYYLSGEYEKELDLKCAEARRQFESITPKNNSVVIFDVDDTALYNWHPMGEFIWQQPKYTAMGWPSIKPAIKPVLDLYKKVQALGYKTIFLTSRSDNDFENTKKELEQAGYTNFEKLILMPVKLAFDRNIKTADWKLSVRKELAKSYDIAGSVGDRDVDFEGGSSGYIVKLPNYLY